jgi:hypothetical protein
MKKQIGSSVLQPGKFIITLTVIALLFTTGLRAQEVKGQAVSESVTVKAIVTAIDQKTRNVSIKTLDGKTYNFTASKAVKNLPQVKKGDTIVAVYTEALAYQVRKHNKETGVAVTQAAAAADSGKMPAAAVVQQTTVAVTITAIDPSIPTVTFKGPQGNTKTIKVKNPANLKGVKVGDVVDITYTEALGIKVEAVKKK